MLEVLIGALLLAAGFYGGRRSVQLEKKPALPPSPAEQELQKLREDRAAFELLMGYDARHAYGGDE